MFWLGAYIRQDRVKVNRMAGSSETKCGLVTPLFTVLTLLGRKNDAEETFTKENPETFQRWMLIKILNPSVTFC